MDRILLSSNCSKSWPVELRIVAKTRLFSKSMDNNDTAFPEVNLQCHKLTLLEFSSVFLIFAFRDWFTMKI